MQRPFMSPNHYVCVPAIQLRKLGPCQISWPPIRSGELPRSTRVLFGRKFGKFMLFSTSFVAAHAYVAPHVPCFYVDYAPYIAPMAWTRLPLCCSMVASMAWTMW
jgi:hypothetical protein